MRAASITAIVNGYKRPYNVDQIILSLLNQSIKPTDIYVWWNDPACADLSRFKRYCNNIVSSKNLGVWARFAFSLNASTEHIVVFDDDTVPGHRWLENCLNHAHLGLLGTIGLIYHGRDRYMNHTRYGWANPNEHPTKVDIVGHSWFFRREWLPAYFSELKPHTGFDLFGEDIHFSYVLQRQLGIPTYVPPHPSHQWQDWGSSHGWLGQDQHAISMDPQASTKWDGPFRHYLDKGFRLISDEI